MTVTRNIASTLLLLIDPALAGDRDGNAYAVFAFGVTDHDFKGRN